MTAATTSRTSDAPARTPRQHWIGTLATAPADDLETLWESLPGRPDYRVLRAAETGLVMTRGRVGGTGKRFNLGEMTVTRCTVRLDSGETGVSYRAGRNKKAAEIAAVADALLQHPGWTALLSERLIAPLRAAQQQRHQQTARHSAATKVDFFTMTRSREQK